MTDVLLADNQPLTAAGITHFLADRDDVNIIGHVSDKDHLQGLLEKHNPGVLIIDYNTPGYLTIEDIRYVRDKHPETHILVVSSDNNKASIMEVLQLGIKAYVTKECSREEVILAIQSASRGEKFFCHKILDVIMEKHFTPEPEACEPTVLTVRETEVLKLIASGYSTQKIADELHLSPHTIHTHRKSIIRKLSIKSPTEFVIYAMDLGIIKPKADR
jgi:DNA-binding NarL/FixJ family response regulator